MDDDIFIRSFTGPKGKWYHDMLANPEADVEFDGKAIHVRGILVKDRATIEAVGHLEKYRDKSLCERHGAGRGTSDHAAARTQVM